MLAELSRIVWQMDREGGARPIVAIAGGDLPAMRFDDGSADGQVDADSARLGAEKALEEWFECLGFDAGTGIFDFIIPRWIGG
jgi:hypothetical protein